jgi:phosphate uptake regulator
MKRKVARIGPSTLMVSLPAPWVKAHNISKGQELEVLEEGNTLLIQTYGKKETLSVNVDLTVPAGSDEQYIKTVAFTIKALYRFGVDEISAQYNDSRIITHIQNLISKQLMGYEIVSQREKTCVIRNLAMGSESEFDNVLRRLFLITLQMGVDALDAVKQKDFDRLGEIAALERTQNKLCNLCERLLNKHGYAEAKYTSQIYVLVNELEQVADAYRDICKELQSKKKVGAKVTSMLDQVNELLRNFYETYYKMDVPRAVAHKGLRNVLKKKCMKELRDAKGEQVLYHQFMTIILQINHMAASLRFV